MKNTILVLALATMVASCKKETKTEFTPTDTTGTTMVKGNVSKNVITPDGNGGYTNTSRIPARGVQISVTIAKSALYPNSTSSGADVYTAVSDSLGNYAVSVRTSGSGATAMITIDGFSGTLDTIVNGVTKRGLLSSYAGTSVTKVLHIGQNFQLDHAFTASSVSSNPNNLLNIGNATISGSVAVSMLREIKTGTLTTITATNVALANHKVYMNFDKDPYSLGVKMYQATTDGNGRYSFSIPTVAMGTTGFSQNATIWIADYAATRDTISLTNTVKPGISGVFQMRTININGVHNGAIRNANHLTYNSFMPD